MIWGEIKAYCCFNLFMYVFSQFCVTLFIVSLFFLYIIFTHVAFEFF